VNELAQSKSHGIPDLPETTDLTDVPNFDDLFLPLGFKRNLERSIIRPVQEGSCPKEHGIILFGPPGTGKTTIPFAIAKKLGYTVFSISPKNFVNDDLSFESSIKECFLEIEQQYVETKNQIKKDEKKKTKKEYNSKLIFIFDEIDEFVVNRGMESDRNSRLMTTMMLPLFNDLREDAEKCGFLFFVMTNYINRFDAAITRKGRFDLVLPIGPPDRISRYHILERTINGLKFEYLKKDIDIRDWIIGEKGEFRKEIDLNTLSTVSDRLGINDIKTICKRVVDNKLVQKDREYQDFLAAKKQRGKTKNFTIHIQTLDFLKWINKHRNSNKEMQEEIDRFYQDYALFSRGSSPNTELNQIQEKVDQEFNSIIVDNFLIPPDQGWQINAKNKLRCELINLNEINLFQGTVKVQLDQVGYSKHNVITKIVRIQVGKPLDFEIIIEPTSKGILKISYIFNGFFVLEEVSALDNKVSRISGKMTKIKEIKID